MHVLHKLTAIDTERRVQFALWEMEGEAILHNTWSFMGILERESVPKEARQCSAAQGPQVTCHALSGDLCRKVVTNARVLLQEVVRQNGGHIEHVLH
jgi:hypothetical protein